MAQLVISDLSMCVVRPAYSPSSLMWNQRRIDLCDELPLLLFASIILPSVVRVPKVRINSSSISHTDFHACCCEFAKIMRGALVISKNTFFQLLLFGAEQITQLLNPTIKIKFIHSVPSSCHPRNGENFLKGPKMSSVKNIKRKREDPRIMQISPMGSQTHAW